MKIKINDGIINLIDKFFNESFILIEKLDRISVINLFDDLRNKLNEFINKFRLILELDKEKHDFTDVFKIQLISRWPVFVFLLSAMTCLGCSAIFHWFSAYGEKTYEILNRLDYAGISILIGGSCSSPYYYFFYCETFYKNLYLVLISIFSLGVIIFSCAPEFNKPHKRKFRGILFLALGISGAFPLLHLGFFSYDLFLINFLVNQYVDLMFNLI